MTLIPSVRGLTPDVNYVPNKRLLMETIADVSLVRVTVGCKNRPDWKKSSLYMNRSPKT